MMTNIIFITSSLNLCINIFLFSVLVYVLIGVKRRLDKNTNKERSKRK